jgi:hypothetical protein
MFGEFGETVMIQKKKCSQPNNNSQEKTNSTLGLQIEMNLIPGCQTNG